MISVMLIISGGEHSICSLNGPVEVKFSLRTLVNGSSVPLDWCFCLDTKCDTVVNTFNLFNTVDDRQSIKPIRAFWGGFL